MTLRTINTLLVTVLAIGFAQGCASQSAKMNTANQNTGEIEADIRSARDSAVKVQHLVTGNLAAYCDDIISDLTDAQSKMPAIRQGLALGATAITERDQERTWWISYRVHRDFKWTIAGIAILLLVLLALWVLSQVAGPVGMVAAPIFHIATGGLVLIGRSISKAVSNTTTSMATTTTATTTATTATVPPATVDPPPAPKPIVTINNPPGTQNAPIG